MPDFRLLKFLLGPFVCLVAAAAHLFLPTSGSNVAMSIPAVQSTLESLTVPLVFTDSAMKVRLIEKNPTRMVWSLSRGPGQSIRITVALEARSSAETRVTVSAELPPAVPGGPGALARLSGRKLFESAFKEQVVSMLENRPFEFVWLYPRLMIATAFNIGTITRGLDQVVEAERERARTNIRKAYEAEATGTPWAPRR